MAVYSIAVNQSSVEYRTFEIEAPSAQDAEEILQQSWEDGTTDEFQKYAELRSDEYDVLEVKLIR